MPIVISLLLSFNCWRYPLQFKTDQVEKDFNNSPILLQIVTRDFCCLSKDYFQIEPVITRVLGKVEGDSGVHAEYRAVDIRDEFMGKRTYKKSQVQGLLGMINGKYGRIDGFETMMHHSFKGGEWHFHIQTTAETIKTRGPLYDDSSN